MTTTTPVAMPQASDAVLERTKARDPYNAWIALAVGLAVFTIYRITLAPDVSFWDAGEFIATSWSLGIPHPPGTPLYVLMGRVFAILFHSVLHVASVAQSVNLLSAIPSSVAALFLYLCVVRVGKKIWADGRGEFCLAAAVAGVTAALFASFAGAVWYNAIQAKGVYAVSGMWAIFAAWLTLVWSESEPKDERILVLVAYLLSLNLGVHLTTYLAALAILPFAFLHERRWALPLSFLVVVTMAKDTQFFLLVSSLLVLPTLQFGLLPAEYGRRNRATLLSAHGLALVISIFLSDKSEFFTTDPGLTHVALLVAPMLLAFAVPWFLIPAPKKLENPFTDFGFLLAAVTVFGFSCHLFLPIRSAMHPAINEAQPDNWRAFWEAILRQQFKPASVFERQAPFVFQFDHMFWRYFRAQWKPEILAWVLGLPGIWLHWRRHAKSFVLFGLLFVWASFALVLKMNFNEHEVRERDYFFGLGFFYYAFWMGIGLGGLVHLSVHGARGASRGVLQAVAAVLAVLVAALPIRGNWREHDYRGNWVAYDYAYNMLVGLEPNAIIFTNGDNDTFPLWYMQEVQNFRKDVRLVNLSLLNTPWYGTQLRDEEPKVPMSRTKDEIWKLRPVQDAKTGEIHWVKDLVANDILNTVYQQGNKRPVYFAVTVDDLMNLDRYLKLQGLVFRFDPNLPKEKGKLAEDSTDVELSPRSDILDNVDLATTRHNLEKLYRYRGLLNANGSLDSTVFRDDNDDKLCTNYAAAWARMAIAYRKQRDMDQAVECMRRAAVLAPNYDPIAGSLGGFLLDAKRFDEAEKYFRERVAAHPHELSGYLGLGYIAQNAGRVEEALDWYLQALRIDPLSEDVLASLFQAYYQLGRLDEAENVLVKWIERNPSDKSARERLEQIRKERAAADSAHPHGKKGG